MDYVQLGSSGLRVSRMALGLALREQTSEQEVARMIAHALDAGINLVDCANTYSPGAVKGVSGTSELLLGHALKGRRDDVVICSKVGQPVGTRPNDAGLSRHNIMREVERSLTRLQTDRIDIYYLHVYDQRCPLEEQLRAMDDLVSQGKILYVGLSNFHAWQLSEALRIQERINVGRFVVAQNAYSLALRRPEHELLPFLRASGTGLVVWAPLAMGLLSGAYGRDRTADPHSLWGRRSEELIALLQGRLGDVLRVLDETADSLGVTSAQVALNWVSMRPEVSAIITGADTVAQLEENLGSLEIAVPLDLLAELDRVSDGLQLFEI